MKSIKLFSLFAVILIAAGALTAFVTANREKKANSDNNGFAVVELFTSEGCSSCPPADELVAKIQKESKDKPVYILAFHVDYWNRLGWKDVFSSADYSQRQSDYANYLHLQSVYTPQIVVDGKTEFIGSEEGTLRAAISNSLKKNPEVKLTLTVSKSSGNEADLKYDIEGKNENTVLLVALVEKWAQTKVERGENGGRTLSHVQIVRKLQKVALNGDSGQTNIVLPKGFSEANWEIIGLLQNKSNGVITGATRAGSLAAINALVKNSR